MPAAAAIVGAALSVGATVAAVAGASTLLVVGLALAGKALTMYSQMQALEDKQEGVKRTVTSTQAALPVVYGKQRIAGKLIDARVDKDSPDDKVLGWVVALCVGSRDGSGIEGIEEAYFDDKLAIDPDATTVVKKPWSLGMDENSSGGHIVGNSGFDSYVSDHINHKFYTGTYSQTVDSDLNTVFPNAWPSTSELRGIAYSRFFLVFNKDKVFPNGSIPNMEFVIKGNRVEDPRDSTWKYSTNSALCVRDFMLSDGYGLGLEASDLDDDSFIAEANFCDEFVDDGDGGTEKRFTCNGIVDTGRSIRRNLEELLSSCRGQIIYQGGKYRLHIPKSKTAVNFHLQDKHIVGDYTWRRAGQEETANSVTATFVSAEDDWSTDDVTFPESGSTNDALTEDGGFRNNTEIQLPFVDHEAQARRIAMVVMKESREDVTISATGTEEVLQLEVGDVIKHSHENPNWDEKKFWVSSMTLQANGGVSLGLTEYSDAAYNIDSYSTSTPPPDASQKDPTTVSQPSNVSATSGSATAISTGEGNNLPRILVTWTKAEDPFLEQTEVRYKEVADPDGNSTSGNWQRTPVVDEKDDQQIYISQVKAGAEYKVQVRSVTTSNFASDWVEINHTVSTDAQHRPIIQTESSESGNTGTVTATVIDPADDSLIDVEWFKRVGQNGYPSTADQTNNGVSSDNSVSFSTSLDSDRNTYVRIVATLQSNSKTAIEEVTLDSDDIPQIEHLGASVDQDTGEVVLSAEGQSDTDNMYFAVGENSSPNDPTAASNDASISGRDGTIVTGVTIGHNSRAYVKGVAANSSGDLGRVKQVTTSREVSGQPIILVDTSESGGTGTLDTEVHDPDGGTLTVRFYERQGNDSSYGSAVDTQSGVTSGTTLSESIALIEKKNSWIKVEAEVEATGEKNSKEAAFDPDKNPNHSGHSLSVDDNGNVDLEILGDTDWVSATYATSTSSKPSTSTVDSGTSVDGRSNTIVNLAALSEGETLYVGIRGWTQTGGTGTKSTEVWYDSVTYRTDTDTKPSEKVQASISTAIVGSDIHIFTTGSVQDQGPIGLVVNAIHGTIETGSNPGEPADPTVASQDFTFSHSNGKLNSDDEWKNEDTAVSVIPRDTVRMKIGLETGNGTVAPGSITEFSFTAPPFKLPDFPDDDTLPQGTKDELGRFLDDMFDKTGDHGGNIVRDAGGTLTVKQASQLERTRYTTEPDAELYTYDTDTSALTGVAVGVREAGSGVGSNAGTFDIYAGAESFTNIGDEEANLSENTDYHVAWNTATDALIVDTDKSTVVGENIVYFGMINSADDIDAGGGGAGPGEGSDGTLQ